MLILKINYTKHLDRAAKSVRYHAFRSREVPTRDLGVFNANSDHADVGRFIKRLDDPLTAEPKCAKMHRLMFSLSRAESDRAGLTGWKGVIREALAAFEQRRGIKLDWIAAEHLSRDHPHVHVDIKSVYTDSSGRRRRLRITQDMRLELRWAVETVLAREKQRTYEQRRRAWEVQRLERALEGWRTHTFHLTAATAARACIRSWQPLLREAVAAVERHHGLRLHTLFSEYRNPDGGLVGTVEVKGSVHVGPKSQKPIDQKQIGEELHWATQALVARELREADLEREQDRLLERFAGTVLWEIDRAAHQEENAYVQPLARRRRRRQRDSPMPDR